MNVGAGGRVAGMRLVDPAVKVRAGIAVWDPGAPRKGAARGGAASGFGHGVDGEGTIGDMWAGSSFDASLLLISTQTWVVLLVPSAILCAIALARRTWAWRHTVAFLAGALIAAVAIDYCDVYILGHMDEKFRTAPEVAFEIGLLVVGATSAVRAVAFLVGLVVVGRIRSVKSRLSSWPVSFGLGILGAVGDRSIALLLGQAGSYVLIAWAWILGFPLVCALVLVKRVGRSDNPAAGSPVDPV